VQFRLRRATSRTSLPKHQRQDYEGAEDEIPVSTDSVAALYPRLAERRGKRIDGSLVIRIALGLIVTVFVVMLLVVRHSERGTPAAFRADSSPATEQDVRAYFLGVWTRPQPSEVLTIWTKFEILPVGTYRFFTAPVTSDGWKHEPEGVGTWSVGRGKFADTGRRYSYLQLTYDGMDFARLLPGKIGFVVSSEGILTPEPTEWDSSQSYRKGDYFPR
jgi:hypothetical protein